MPQISKKQKKQTPKNFCSQTPFNFCDRWCGRCDLVDQCQAFKDVFTHRLKHVVKGEDPDSPDVIFADMRKTFNRLVRTIKKDIKERGLNPKEVKIKLINPGLNKGPRLENFPLWSLGHGFMISVNSLLENIFSDADDESLEVLDSLKKEIEELTWYHTFFEARLYHALVIQSVLKKEKDRVFKKMGQKDMNISAKLAFCSLLSCQKALEKLSKNYLGYMGWSKDLSISAKSILEKIETKFSGCHRTKVIFHGS